MDSYKGDQGKHYCLVRGYGDFGSLKKAFILRSALYLLFGVPANVTGHQFIVDK